MHVGDMVVFVWKGVVVIGHVLEVGGQWNDGTESIRVEFHRENKCGGYAWIGPQDCELIGYSWAIPRSSEWKDALFENR